MVLAAFIFPVALMFLVTGGLYIWGMKGSYSSEVHIIELNEPLAKDEGKLQSLIEDELRELSVEPPSGEKKIKAGGTSFKAEWSGSETNVVLEPTADVLFAKLTIEKATWYQKLVQLH